jgi:hypothetical protein
MRRISFCGVIVAGLVMGFAVSSLNAGSPPAEGGSVTGTRNDYGNPINGSAGGLQTTSSGLQGVSSSNADVPGGNSYGGSNDASATSAVHERGVAGSGLPREKVTVVDTKSLRSTKTDTTFSTSLLSADLKSVKDVKPVTATQKQTKSHAQTDKALPSAKVSEKSTTKSADDNAAKR